MLKVPGGVHVSDPVPGAGLRVLEEDDRDDQHQKYRMMATAEANAVGEELVPQRVSIISS